MKVWSGPLVGAAQEEIKKISLPFFDIPTSLYEFWKFALFSEN
jgi:hypothetical protein